MRIGGAGNEFFLSRQFWFFFQDFFLFFISMKRSSPFIWGIIYFCNMDGFFRILEKTSFQLICTRLYVFFWQKQFFERNDVFWLIIKLDWANYKDSQFSSQSKYYPTCKSCSKQLHKEDLSQSGLYIHDIKEQFYLLIPICNLNSSSASLLRPVHV